MTCDVSSPAVALAGETDLSLRCLILYVRVLPTTAGF